VVENNGIAQTTETSRTLGGSLLARGPAFGLAAWSLDDADPQFLERAEGIVAEVRERRRPGLLVIETQRLGPHSKGDDLRSEDEKQRMAARDPLQRLRARLPAAVADLADQAAGQFLRDVQAAALASPAASRPAVPRNIFGKHAARDNQISARAEQGQTVRAALNASLRGMLAADQRVLLLGEDMHEPYGGAFKITQGLSSDYPDRVISTPISEAGIVGAGIGLALAGLRPLVEIMFADFVTLAFDQIYNHAAKFPGMFEHASVPLVIRMAAGRAPRLWPDPQPEPRKPADGRAWADGYIPE
jgi:2-oxoisovalerate dehydrogenase E1 component